MNAFDNKNFHLTWISPQSFNKATDLLTHHLMLSSYLTTLLPHFKEQFDCEIVSLLVIPIRQSCRIIIIRREELANTPSDRSCTTSLRWLWWVSGIKSIQFSFWNSGIWSTSNLFKLTKFQEFLLYPGNNISQAGSQFSSLQLSESNICISVATHKYIHTLNKGAPLCHAVLCEMRQLWEVQVWAENTIGIAQCLLLPFHFGDLQDAIGNAIASNFSRITGSANG